MKFIIEISKNYIKERTNEEYLQEALTQSGDKTLTAIVEMMAFQNIMYKIEEGKEEFVINVDPSTLEKTPKDAYNHVTAAFATSYVLLSEEKK